MNNKKKETLKTLNLMLELIEQKHIILDAERKAAHLRFQIADVIVESGLSDKKKLEMLHWVNEQRFKAA